MRRDWKWKRVRRHPLRCLVCRVTIPVGTLYLWFFSSHSCMCGDCGDEYVIADTEGE